MAHLSSITLRAASRWPGCTRTIMTPAHDRSTCNGTMNQWLYLAVADRRSGSPQSRPRCASLALEAVDPRVQRLGPIPNIRAAASLMTTASASAGSLRSFRSRPWAHAQSHDFDEIAIYFIHISPLFALLTPSGLNAVHPPRPPTRYCLRETHCGDAAVLQKLRLEGIRA